jgi:hypothetical protein
MGDLGGPGVAIEYSLSKFRGLLNVGRSELRGCRDC